MSTPGSDRVACSSIKVKNQSLDQIGIILGRKTTWNKVFKEISTVEGDFYRQLREFGENQEKYLTIVNELLDSFLSDELTKGFSSYKEIEAKYNGVVEGLRHFKVKLTEAGRFAERVRIEWLDGFLLDQLKFVQLSAEKREEMVNRSEEGDRITAKARSMFNGLMAEWIQSDLEDRFKDCLRRVEEIHKISAL